MEEKKLNEEQLNEEEIIQEEEQVQDTQSAGEEAETQDIEQEAEATEEASEEAEKQEKKSGKKKSLFDKKDNKLQEKVDELEDRVKRQMAEFENFRKRTEKEKSAMFETGAKSVIEKMLPVVDNFERGLAALSEEEKKQPFAEGMNMVYKQLMAELEKLEVKPIETVGCEFNPDVHNAVMHVEDESLGENTVVAVFQKGFKIGEKVIRFAMVQVAN